MMFPKRILLFVLGLFSGAAVSAGAFAFLLVIGVVPRMLRRIRQNKHILCVENVIIGGITVGCVLSLLEGIPYAETFFQGVREYGWMAVPDQVLWNTIRILAHGVVIIYGISAGIFVGCIAAALAEILNTFPIVFERLRLSKGLQYAMGAMALGKFFGSIFSFFGGYHF